MSNRKYLPTLLLLIALWSTNKSYSQKLADVIYLSYTTLPSTNVKADDDTKWSTQRFDVAINAKINIKDSSWKVFPFIQYTHNYVTYETSENSTIPETDLNLHSIKGGFNVLKSINHKLGLLISGNIALRSDLSSATGTASYFPGLLFAATYQFNTRLLIQAGISFNNDLNKNSLVPYIGYTYKSKNNKISSELIFPNFHITYHPTLRSEFGLSASFDGTIHTILPIALDNNRYGESQRMQIISVGPAAGFKLIDNVWITGRAGITLLRENEIWDSNDNIAVKPNSDGENSWFTRFVLSYRFY